MILDGKTYAFSGIVGGIVSYVERSLGLSALFSTVTASLRSDASKIGQQAKNLFNRQTWKLTIHVPADPVEGCCPTDPVLGLAECTISVRISSTLGTTARTDFADQIKDLTATTEFRNALISLVTPTS